MASPGCVHDNGPVTNAWDGFVGREQELAGLRTLLQQAEAGRPRLVVVEGPAGIGKTALVRRLLNQPNGWSILRASGEETETSLPYEIVAQLLTGVTTDLPVPLDTLCSATGRAADPLDVGAALIDLLGVLQHHGPVVLAVDDAQWADTPSLHALAFAFRRLRVDRVLAVVAVRELADPHLPEPVRRALAAEHGRHLRLTGLAITELRELAEQLSVDALSGRTLVRLHEHTQGNPLHARALLEEVPAAGLRDTSTLLPAPRLFAQLVVRRLTACPPLAAGLVAAAAVLGVTCSLDLAAQLAGLDEPLAALEEASTARLLQHHQGQAGVTVAFVHPLIRAAVYQTLGPARRAALHAHAATLLDDQTVALHHRVRATIGPDPVLATELTAYARSHTTSGAWASAADALAAAAQLTPDRPAREQLLVETVEAKLLAGDVAEAADLGQQITRFAHAAWRSYILARLAFVNGHLDHAEPLLNDAWQQCDPTTDPVLAARIAGQLGALSALYGRGQDATDWADRALHLAPEQTATDLIHYIPLIGQGISGHADAALRAVANLPDPAVASAAELEMLLGRGPLRSWTDDLTGAARDLQGVLAVCHSRSMPFQLLANATLAEVEYRLGRWDDAVAHSEQAVSIAVDADQAWLAPYAHATAALVPAARGEWSQASAHIRSAYALIPEGGILANRSYAASAHAHLATARGDPEAVVNALRPLVEPGPHEGAYEPGVVPSWQDLLVDALTSLGQYEAAEAALVPFATLAAERDRRSVMAVAARARGNLAAARGDRTQAHEAFSIALDHAATVDVPFDRARIQFAYGAFMRRAGKRRVAGEHLQAARALFARLSAHPYLEQCDRELSACGQAITIRPTRSPAELTPQEVAVARLAAHGLTNRQIARELVLSSKTVDYHLGHVYAKLQVTSRVQLAARFPKTRQTP
jgi:ATP/maltotriose-dependent transcriptional regulator MalT